MRGVRGASRTHGNGNHDANGHHPVSVRVHKPKSASKDPTWLIMLYLSGDNNLSPEMVRALTDIKLQGVPKGITFTIQYDPRAPGFETYRYCIDPRVSKAKLKENAERNNADGPLPIPEYLRDRLQKEDSADPVVVASFVRWSLEQNPAAAHRMLILSGHGSGAVGDFLVDNNGRGGRSTSLTIPLLAKALHWAEHGCPPNVIASLKRACRVAKSKKDATRAAQKDAQAKLLARGRRTLPSAGRSGRFIDVLGMDSCLMGMAEVAYEVSPSVRYLVGSEGFLPNTGWPYSHLLAKLAKRRKNEKSPVQVAAAVVRDTIAYYQQYIPAGTSVDMAACDLDRLPPVATAVRELVASLAVLRSCDEPGATFPVIVRDLVVAAHWRGQSYKFEQYTDLWDFCDQLAQGSVRAGTLMASHHGAERGRLARIEKACNAVKEAIVDLTTVDGTPPAHSGPEFQHSHGLAVFFPWSTLVLGGTKALRGYKGLAFSKASNWFGFLTTCLTKTEREGRKEDGKVLAGTERPILPPSGPVGARFSEGVSKHSDGVSKHSDTVSKFADLILMLSPGTTTLPWSMKNPPQGVRWPKPRDRHERVDGSHRTERMPAGAEPALRPSE